MRIQRTILGRVTTANNQMIKVRMAYNTADPYAVSFTFVEDGADTEDVEWLFARDLLAEALTVGYSGEGDVMLKADHRLVTLSVSAPEGDGVIEMPRAEVYGFASGIFHVVPRGQEAKEYDVDAFIAQTLEGSS